jgi:transcriptional repressor NrdR
LHSEKGDFKKDDLLSNQIDSIHQKKYVDGENIIREFSVDKLRRGFGRALHKRPVATELVEESIKRIQQKLLARGEREIEALRVGEMVMEELRRLDKVAYVRFASVYRSFQDIDEFRDVIRDL